MRFASLIVLAAMAATPALAQAPKSGSKPAAPASTQPASGSAQQLCYYNHLPDKALDEIRNAFVSGSAKDSEAIKKSMKAAQAACAKLYTYTDRQDTLALVIAQRTAVSDLAYTTMVRNGFDDIGKVLGLWNALSAQDLNTLLNPKWRENNSFREALSAKLVNAGVPQKPVVIESAQILLEQVTLNAAAFDQWSVDEKAPASSPPATSKP